MSKEHATPNQYSDDPVTNAVLTHWYQNQNQNQHEYQNQNDNNTLPPTTNTHRSLWSIITAALVALRHWIINAIETLICIIVVLDIFFEFWHLF